MPLGGKFAPTFSHQNSSLKRVPHLQGRTKNSVPIKGVKVHTVVKRGKLNGVTGGCGDQLCAWKDFSTKQLTCFSLRALRCGSSSSRVPSPEASDWCCTHSGGQEGHCCCGVKPRISHLLLHSTQLVGTEPDHLCSQPLNGPAGSGRGSAAGRGSCRVPGSNGLLAGKLPG